MNKLQRMGGLAALYEAAAYIAGMVGFLLIVDVSGITDPVQKVAMMAENKGFLYLMHLIIYVIWGIFMVVLSLALQERDKENLPSVSRLAAIFGILWGCVIIASGMIYNTGMLKVIDIYETDPNQAATVWLAVDAVFSGLGGGTEILGGIWILLVSLAALRSGSLPRVLNILGIIIGIAGIVSVVPVLAEILIYIFALGQIIWFIWLGIFLLRHE
jgi:hypothetical protein